MYKKSNRSLSLQDYEEVTGLTFETTETPDYFDTTLDLEFTGTTDFEGETGSTTSLGVVTETTNDYFDYYS